MQVEIRLKKNFPIGEVVRPPQWTLMEGIIIDALTIDHFNHILKMGVSEAIEICSKPKDDTNTIYQKSVMKKNNKKKKRK